MPFQRFTYDKSDPNSETFLWNVGGRKFGEPTRKQRRAFQRRIRKIQRKILLQKK